MKELRSIVAHLTTKPEAPAALATLVSVAGSSYRRPGARLLLTTDGQRIGSISGGCLEEDVLAHASQVLETGCAELLKYDTTSENDLVWGVGLGCHGIVHVLIERLPGCPEWATTLAANWASRRTTTLEVTWSAIPPAKLGTRTSREEISSESHKDTSVFVDRVLPPTRLLVFGAGDDAQPLHRIAAEIGWDVVIADPRPGYVTRERFPAAQTLVTGSAERLVSQSKPDTHCVAVVMTHHYVHDLPILRELLPFKLPYLGLLGPKKRGVKILTDLANGGLTISDELRSLLYSPIGLDIGAETPEEVAVSIVAEIRSVLSGRTGGALKNRERPIHEDTLPA